MGIPDSRPTNIVHLRYATSDSLGETTCTIPMQQSTKLSNIQSQQNIMAVTYSCHLHPVLPHHVNTPDHSLTKPQVISPYSAMELELGLPWSQSHRLDAEHIGFILPTWKLLRRPRWSRRPTRHSCRCWPTGESEDRSCHAAVGIKICFNSVGSLNFINIIYASFHGINYLLKTVSWSHSSQKQGHHPSRWCWWYRCCSPRPCCSTRSGTLPSWENWLTDVSFSRTDMMKLVNYLKI